MEAGLVTICGVALAAVGAWYKIVHIWEDSGKAVSDPDYAEYVRTLTGRPTEQPKVTGPRLCRLVECVTPIVPASESEGFCYEHYKNLLSWMAPRPL